MDIWTPIISRRSAKKINRANNERGVRWPAGQSNVEGYNITRTKKIENTQIIYTQSWS